MTADVENDGDGRRPRAWGERARPPMRRPTRIVQVRLGGEGGRSVHMAIGLDREDCAEARPLEVFVTVDKDGSVFRGLLDTIARFVSAELQRGAPLREVVKMLRHVHFEPSGMVSDHEAIADCSSIVDLVGQLLAHEFPEAP